MSNDFKTFNGFIKGKEKPNGGNYWNNAGFTLFQGTYEGKPQLSMIDNRTGLRVSFFPVEKREPQGQGTSGGQGASGTEPF